MLLYLITLSRKALSDEVESAIRAVVLRFHILGFLEAFVVAGGSSPSADVIIACPIVVANKAMSTWLHGDIVGCCSVGATGMSGLSHIS